MGDSLVILTYHSDGMGIPEDLFEGGIGYRAGTYYDFAAGGAAAGGKDVGTIHSVGVENLTANSISMIADLTVSSIMSTTLINSADITVTVKANEPIPANSKLLIMVTETELNWFSVYEIVPSNGQTVIYNVVRAIVSDSAGSPLPQLKAGETHSVTGTFTCKPKLQNPNNLRVAALIQVEDTKEILSVVKTKTTPVDTASIPIIFNSNLPEKADVQIAFVGSHQLIITLPFSNAKALVYNTSGRILQKQICNGNEGHRVSISLPQAEGVLFVKLISEKGYSTIFKIPVRN